MPLPSLYAQSIAVLSANSEPAVAFPPNVIQLNEAQNYAYARMPLSTSTDLPLTTQNVAFKETISSVPVVSASELLNEYQELGEALTQMSELDPEDEWKIEAPVYEAARNVAYFLMINLYPAPQIMHHGSKSIVFNWTTSESNNLYLTISSDKMSALISSPEKIKRRLEFLNQNFISPAAALCYIKADYLEKPVTSTVSPSSELVLPTR